MNGKMKHGSLFNLAKAGYNRSMGKQKTLGVKGYDTGGSTDWTSISNASTMAANTATSLIPKNNSGIDYNGMQTIDKNSGMKSGIDIGGKVGGTAGGVAGTIIGGPVGGAIGTAVGTIGGDIIGAGAGAISDLITNPGKERMVDLNNKNTQAKQMQAIKASQDASSPYNQVDGLNQGASTGFKKGGRIGFDESLMALVESEGYARGGYIKGGSSHYAIGGDIIPSTPTSPATPMAPVTQNTYSLAQKRLGFVDGGVIPGAPGKEGRPMNVEEGDFIVDGNHIKQFIKDTGMPAKKAPMNSGGVPIRAGEHNKPEYLLKEDEANTLYNMGYDLNKYAPNSEEKFKPNNHWFGGTAGSASQYNNGGHVNGNPYDFDPQFNNGGEVFETEDISNLMLGGRGTENLYKGGGSIHPFPPGHIKRGSMHSVGGGLSNFNSGGNVTSYYDAGTVKGLDPDTFNPMVNITNKKDNFQVAYGDSLAQKPGYGQKTIPMEGAELSNNYQSNTNQPNTDQTKYYPSSYNSQDSSSPQDLFENKSIGNEGRYDFSKKTPIDQFKSPASDTGLDTASNIYYGGYGVVTGLKTLYDLSQNYTPGPKPIPYNPQIHESDFEGQRVKAEDDIARSGATARYNAREAGQTALSNAGIHANELQSRLGVDAQIHSMKEQERKENINVINEASRANIQAENLYNMGEYERNQQFRLMKGQSISQDLHQLGSIGRDYIDTRKELVKGKLGIKDLSTATEIDKWAKGTMIRDDNESALRVDFNNSQDKFDWFDKNKDKLKRYIPSI